MGELTSKQIETLSVNKVIVNLSLCKFLDANKILEKDKIPIWDGEVRIYSNEDQKNENFLGKVMIQIKGKEDENLSKESITYPIKKVYLEAFLKQGGSIFFVVLVSPDGEREKIYYLTCTPIKIHGYLKKFSDNQQTLSLNLKEFPQDNQKKGNIFLNFHNHCKKQTSFRLEDMITLDEIEEGLINDIKFTFSSLGSNPENIEKIIQEEDIYFYGTRDGSSVEIPIAFIPDNILALEVIKWNVLIEDKVYYSEVLRDVKDEFIEFSFGENLKIKLNKTDNKIIINHKFSPWLKQVYNDLEFIINIFEQRHFYIGANKIEITPSEEEIKYFNSTKIKDIIVFLRKFINLFNKLHFEKDIEIFKLSKRDSHEWNILFDAILEEKEVSNLLTDISMLTIIKLSEIKIFLYFNQNSEDKTKYKIQDYFHSDIRLFYNGEDDDEKLVTSHYSLLQPEDYLSLSNIDFDDILNSYIRLEPQNPNIFVRANIDLLNLISAIDMSDGNNKKIINSAKELAEWIFNEENDISYEVKYINLMQIYKRQRELSEEEKRELVRLSDKDYNQRENIFKCATHLLLDNLPNAEYFFDKLTKEEKEEFISLPINYFRKKN